MIGSRGEWRDEHDKIVCVPADDNVRDGEADDKFRCAAQIVECVALLELPKQVVVEKE